jgi:hypothetical protein
MDKLLKKSYKEMGRVEDLMNQKLGRKLSKVKKMKNIDDFENAQMTKKLKHVAKLLIK